MEKRINFNITYKSGKSFSDSTIYIVLDETDLKAAIANFRDGSDGTDVSGIDYISCWDDEGNEY